MRNFVFVVIILNIMAVTASAQERVAATISILEFSTANTRFMYPNAPGFISSGQDNMAHGLSGSLNVKINDYITTGYRIERSMISNAFDIAQTTTEYRRVESLGNVSGISRYQEFFGSIRLKHTGGHRLLVGVARTTFNRSWKWHELGGISSTSSEISSIGLLFGAEGRRILKNLSFDYAGRYYPSSKRTEKSTVGTVFERTSSGFEVSGAVTYPVASHISLTGGYRYRRTGSQLAEDPYPVEGQIINQGLTIGVRLLF